MSKDELIELYTEKLALLEEMEEALAQSQKLFSQFREVNDDLGFQQMRLSPPPIC